jgi:TPR repeat protein
LLKSKEKALPSSSSLTGPSTASIPQLSLNSALEAYKLGEDQLLGRNKEKLPDEKKAFKNIKRASIKNHVQAQAVLAFCFEFGLGTEQDFVAVFTRSTL